MCRGSPGRYRTERGTVVVVCSFASERRRPTRKHREVVVEVGSGAWWFTLVLAITIAVRLVWAIRSYRKRDDDDGETP